MVEANDPKVDNMKKSTTCKIMERDTLVDTFVMFGPDPEEAIALYHSLRESGATKESLSKAG